VRANAFWERRPAGSHGGSLPNVRLLERTLNPSANEG